MSNPKDFQRNSANYIVKLFQKGQQRILLADEVGLGKTFVAKNVVERMHKKAKKAGDKFKVIYVCSNQNIIQQNAHKLGIPDNDVVPISRSRLSMLHRTLFQQLEKDYLIPITPATSLKQTYGYGNAHERSLIYSLIREKFDKSEQDDLKWYLDVYAVKNTQHTYQFTDDRIEDIKSRNSAYYNFIQSKLKVKLKFSEAITGIKAELHKQKPDYKYISYLRTIFSEISMDMLNPNLVIMDEFQRYRDLMENGKNTEENRLAQKMFNAESNPKILLVSATPYEPFATMEDVSQVGKNIPYDEFKSLMKFLMDNDYEKFEADWRKYSDQLSSLSHDNIEDFKKAKKMVERKLRQVMVRTERYAPNLTKYEIQTVIPTAKEIEEYALFRTLLKRSADVSKTSKSPQLNIDYVKSSPFLLSFMQQYVEKTFIENAFKQKRGPKKQIFKGLLLNDSLITENKKLKFHHAKLEALCNMLFQSGKNAANLLWVPPSIPYYKTKGVFGSLSDFSKILVFSKWGFVPRMLATLISYEATRQFTIKNTETSEHNALEKYKELLLSPFPQIAELFNQHEECKDLVILKNQIKAEVIVRLKPYIPKFNVSKRKNYKNLLMIMKLMNGERIAPETISYNKKIIDEVVNIIIASPGICMWRCFGQDYGDNYEACTKSGLYEFSNAFINMLGNEESQAIIKRNTQNSAVFDRTIEYCTIGNLQAVIDEYAYVLGYDKHMKDEDKLRLWKTIESSIIIRSPLEIDTDDTFCQANKKKKQIQRWLACDFSTLSTDDKQEQRKLSVQAAFNSPFRPFVLASTSVGQEGLDFHLYCRKIVHWNLPTNPINLEQRSGRINRYECLAIRRSVAHLINDTLDWKELFKKANEEWKTDHDYNDMVPHWCLPKEIIEKYKITDENKVLEWIENIFLIYPMSVDNEIHSNLMRQLSLYRFTMGQPDQEFIIGLLDELNLPHDVKDQLIIHLSPSIKS